MQKEEKGDIDRKKDGRENDRDRKVIDRKKERMFDRKK